MINVSFHQEFVSNNLSIVEDVRKLGVKYIEYVDLIDFDRPDAYNEYFDEAIMYTSSDDWKEHFFSLETLRKINKFSPDVIDARIMEVYQFINDCINSPRTSLTKNCLVLIQEIFMTSRSEKLVEFASLIAPIIELKIGYEYNMIQVESKFALQFLSASIPYPKVIEAICSGCDSKVQKIKN